MTPSMGETVREEFRDRGSEICVGISDYLCPPLGCCQVAFGQFPAAAGIS